MNSSPDQNSCACCHEKTCPRKKKKMKQHFLQNIPESTEAIFSPQGHAEDQSAPRARDLPTFDVRDQPFSEYGRSLDFATYKPCNCRPLSMSDRSDDDIQPKFETQEEREDNEMDEEEERKLSTLSVESVDRLKKKLRVGPDWYTELSNIQMRYADALGEALRLDKDEEILTRTWCCLDELGIYPRPKKKVVLDAMELFSDPSEFLMELFRCLPKEDIIEFDRREGTTTYSQRTRLILSTVAYLQLPQVLKELEPYLPPKKPKRGLKTTPQGDSQYSDLYRKYLKESMKTDSPYAIPQSFHLVTWREMEEAIRRKKRKQKMREERQLKKLYEDLEKLFATIPPKKGKRKKKGHPPESEEEQPPPQEEVKICEFSSNPCTCAESDSPAEMNNIKGSRYVFIRQNCGCVFKKAIVDEFPKTGDIVPCTNPECRGKCQSESDSLGQEEKVEDSTLCACANLQNVHNPGPWCIDVNTEPCQPEGTDASVISVEVQGSPKAELSGSKPCTPPEAAPGCSKRTCPKAVPGGSKPSTPAEAVSGSNKPTSPAEGNKRDYKPRFSPEVQKYSISSQETVSQGKKRVSFTAESIVWPYHKSGMQTPSINSVPGPPLLKKSKSSGKEKNMNADNYSVQDVQEPLVVDFDNLAALKQFMYRLALEGNTLAALPDSYLLPPIRHFLEQKKGEPLTKEKIQELFHHSRMLWQQDKHTHSIRVPKNIVPYEEFKQLTVIDIPYLRNKAYHIEDKCYRELKKQLMDCARENWSTMFMEKFPYHMKNFKDAYFTYLPSREKDVMLKRHGERAKKT